MRGDFRNCWKDINKDYVFLRGHYPKIKNIVSAYFFNPGFKSVLLLRVQLLVYKLEWKRLAQLISNYNLSRTGAEFCTGLVIGSPLVIRHPCGIVVGGGVIIGDNCTLLHGTTLGRANLQNSSAVEYPIIGNHVVFGAFSSALGGITIADGVTLGAHSLLLNSAEKKGTYVGMPAKLVETPEQHE